MRREGQITRCVLCHAAIGIRLDDEVNVHFDGIGGHRTQRVLSVRGVEVHRCALLGPRLVPPPMQRPITTSSA